MKVHFYYSVIFFLISYLAPAQSLEFASLTCNSQTNPIAMDCEQPLFSWIINAEGFNRSQNAYQVLVDSQEKWLNEKDADFWNSAKVESAQSAHVKYRGKIFIIKSNK